MVIVDGAALQDKLEGFSIGHVGFEMSVRYSSRAVQTTGSMNLDFWRESWTRERNFVVTKSSGLNCIHPRHTQFIC